MVLENLYFVSTAPRYAARYDTKFGRASFLVLCGSLCSAQAPGNAQTKRRQKMNKADRESARKIRKSDYGGKTLSTYAHNVKIIVQDGRVTLKGPVRTAAEKNAVERKAVGMAGAKNVVIKSTIAPAERK